jgi:mono/diheme cytochrome c family protein
VKRLAVALAATLSFAAAAPATGAPPETQRSPEINYMLHCQGCHRPDGSGAPGAVPDLRGHVSVFLGSPAGRAFLVRVPGSANAPLSDAELAELLVWIVYRFDPAHVPADFAPYDAAEVGRLRVQQLSKVRDERAAILAALSATDPAASPPAGSPRPGAAGAPDRRSP